MAHFFISLLTVLYQTKLIKGYPVSQLIKCINEKVINNTEEVHACLVNMICDDSSPIPLTQETILHALKIDGEFLGLKMRYDEYENELKDEILKYKISQSLSVVVSYEDDGHSFENIEKFISYMKEISDDNQNFIFGIKNVKELSKTPITILFSGILPINQLHMSIGKNIYSLIHSDNEYFIPRFAKLRDDISQEINIPILPIFPVLDSSLKENQARLIDKQSSVIIADFYVGENLDKEALEIYLIKLFYIYKQLALKQNISKKAL